MDRSEREWQAVLVRKLIADAEKESRNLGTYHPYVYLNHAAEWQDPIEGYESDNWRLLNDTSRVYVPKGIFQRLVPGGFKIG